MKLSETGDEMHLVIISAMPFPLHDVRACGGGAARVCRHFTGLDLIPVLQGCACDISGQCNDRSASGTGCTEVCVCLPWYRS